MTERQDVVGPKCTLPQFKTYDEGVRVGWRQAIRAAWHFIDTHRTLSEPKAGTPMPAVADMMADLERRIPAAHEQGLPERFRGRKRELRF